ncbi:hypothetical protein AVEN_191104-1 [Araneus ventricosus]|uniref:Transposase Tc1-like domain-containing protein n=1 Tax=Araneus ventricosus TaxID=182803 RepID=A0A4Y2B0M6_ARAVE|nr:hypothetical protein AVEN_191104-1 [Araneus ventricosus]
MVAKVKLFTSALKPFSAIPIVMAQRKHLNDFLRGSIGRLECGRTQLEYPRLGPSVISRLWQRFQDDGNVSRCYSTGRPELQRNEDRIWQLLPKETETQHQTCLVSSLQLPVRQFQGRPCTRRLGHIGLYAGRPVRCVPLTATHCRLRLAWSRSMHCGHRNSGLV